MKKALCLIVLLLAVQNCWAVGINRFQSGSWYNALQNGHGLSVEVISDTQTVIYWFVYHPDGTPTFLIAVGTNKNNRVEADVFYNSGMKFGDFDPKDITEVPWGTIVLTFHSCNSATLEYDSPLEHNGVAYGSGSIELTKLLTISELQCSDQPQAGIYQGDFVSRISDAVMPGLAIISPDGSFSVITYEDMVSVGDWTFNGSTFSGSGKAVSADPDVDFSSNVSFTAKVGPEYRLVGSYNITGGDHADFDLYSVPAVYRRMLSLEDLAGDYDFGNHVSGADGSASLSDEGELTATDSDGCKYSGDISLPDAQFNLVKVTLTITKCGSVNGQYVGYGVQLDYFSLGDRRILRIVTSNDSYAAVFDLFN